jgi:D-arabinose 1-dehydrogenase-like Zn-dependent alcohol dehydrogenase
MQIAKAGGAQVFAIDTRQMSLDLAGDLGADATMARTQQSGPTILT